MNGWSSRMARTMLLVAVRVVLAGVCGCGVEDEMDLGRVASGSTVKR